MEVTFDGGKVITAHINGHIIRTDQPEKLEEPILHLHLLIFF